MQEQRHSDLGLPGSERSLSFLRPDVFSGREIETVRERISTVHILTIAGLDKERTSHDKNSFIVDMWLVDPEDLDLETPAISAPQAIELLEANIELIDKVGLQNLPSEFEYIRATEDSVIAFLQEEELVKSGGEKTPYDEFHQRVNSIKPFNIPEEQLELTRAELIEEAKNEGLDFEEEDDQSLAQALKEFQKSTVVKDKKDIEAHFRRFESKHRNRISEILGKNLSEIDFSIEWENTRAFWMMWERITQGRWFLRANWDKKHRDSWTIGKIEYYATHELSHFYYAYLLKEQIEDGNLDPAVGLFTIPGPGCFQLEGIAQTIADLASLDISSEGRLALKLYRLEKRALANGLVAVENGEAIEDVSKRLTRHMPLKTEEEIREDLIDGTQKPFARAYTAIYGWSDLDFMEIRKKFGEEGTENVILPNLMMTILTRNQLIHPTLDLHFLKRE